MTFSHLNIQSGYSLMDSTIKIDDLVKQAKALGYESLALTDKNVMSGSVAFYQACQKYKIHPILGVKIKIQVKQEDFLVVLLAENNEGYQNLMKISSWIQTQGITPELDQLDKFSSGLVVVINTSQSPWADWISREQFVSVEEEFANWEKIFGEDNVYLSIEDRDLHEERQLHQPLQKWSRDGSVQVVAIGDVKYLHKEDAVAYQAMRAMEEGSRLSSDSDSRHHHQYLKSPEEMEGFFKEWWPEVLDETSAIAQRCHVELNFDQQLLPTYPVPGGQQADEYLRELCEESLNKKYGKDHSEAKARLDHELSVITSMKFSDYFLIVWDFIAFARQKGIHAGPGRGSAAGSLVAFLLDITQVDPLKYNLLFERFLNPERITMPDIDIDFPDHRRDEVIRYVVEKYGRHHVAQICTFGTFAARSVLRELFKVMAIDESDATYLLKHIPRGSNDSLVEMVKNNDTLKDYIRNSDRLKRLFHVASKLEGLPRHVSTHAAGVVISEHPLIQYTALMNGQGAAYLTQLAMGDLEKVGLLKIDFLGLRNLSFIEKIESKIQKYRDEHFSAEKIPLDDKDTFELLAEGRTNGIFQLESQGMRNVLKRLKPTHFEDVVAVNALYRPGPMEYIPIYINRKHEKESVQYPHPDLQPILQSTFGVLVYQEQIMQVARKVAGYSLGQADLLRRAVGKKQADVLAEQRERFVEGCLSEGYRSEVAHQLFEWIVKFSNYGFNRSHAVAYSFISYKLAYMKAHYPTYFLAELINTYVGDAEKVTAYIREARESGLTVLSPSVNRSQIITIDEQGNIRIGLLSIKGVGAQAAQQIVEERQNGRYRSLNDFCLRSASKLVSRSVIESLILAGAFDDLDENRAKLLANIDQALEQADLFKEFRDQPDLFGGDFDMGAAQVEIEPFPLLKKLAMEKEVLGTYLSEHPLEGQRKFLRERGILPISQLSTMMNRKVELAAVVESLKEIRTKRGDPMAFLTFSDEKEELEGVLFPDAYREVRKWLQEQLLVLVSGKVEERRGQRQLIVQSISPFEAEQPPFEPSQRVFLKVSEKQEKDMIEWLKQLSNYFPGNTPLVIFRAEDRKTYQLGEEFAIQVSKECLDRLKQKFGSESIAVRSKK
ncbi:DNA polymerase III subunit alpha [Halobacillus fulvus]|nr:DNA polymerase III subunit alpha [Halobacillus fulvus]